MQVDSNSPKKPKLTYVLWTIQVLLALVFLFAGGVKLVGPIEDMVKQTSLSGAFLRFIGVAECLGGLGMILPGLLRIRTGLTPLAAAGLVIIMIGATVVTMQSMGFVAALSPLVVGLLAAFVGYSRWRLLPLSGRAGTGTADSAVLAR